MGSGGSEREERPRAGVERGAEGRVRGGRSRGDNTTFISIDAKPRELGEPGDKFKGGGDGFHCSAVRARSSAKAKALRLGRREMAVRRGS